MGLLGALARTLRLPSLTRDLLLPGGPGGGDVELLRLNYIDETNADPLVSIEDWTIDRHFAALTRLTDSGWEGKTTNGTGSMHADAAIINLNSGRIFVGVDNITIPSTAVAVAFIVTSGYAPGAFWTLLDGFETDGYQMRVSGNNIIAYGYDGSGSSYANSGTFGNPLGGSGGTLGRVEMRVVIGSSSNVVQCFVDGTQLGSDWVDVHANRIAEGEFFNTIGAALAFITGAGAAGIIEEVYCGTF